MVRLLRGLLAPNSVARLSAKAALSLPIFNQSKNQNLNLEENLINTQDEDYLNTMESIEPVNSVKSLEIRSAMMRKSRGSNSDHQSIGSIRLEGDQPEKEGKVSQFTDNLYKKSLLRRLGSHNLAGSSGTSGGFLTPRQGKVSIFGRRDSADSFVSREGAEEVSPNMKSLSLCFRTASKDRPVLLPQSPLARQASLFASKPTQRSGSSRSNSRLELELEDSST